MMVKSMENKSRISYGVVLLCMIAILLFGSKLLSNDAKVVDSLSVQGMNQDKTEEPVDKLEPLEPYMIVDQDVYEADLEKANEQRIKEELKKEETKEEVTPKVEEEKETLKEEEEESNSLELAIEAVNIKNPKLSVDAKAAILMNADTKEILYNKSGLDKIQPASTAKLLTAIVAVELSDEKEEFVVGKEINLIASDSSRAYLRDGQVLSLSQILDALLLPSGNDAAYTIAANIGRKIAADDSLKPKDAVAIFVEKMNETAKEIGVVCSVFKGPDGYDAIGQYTTAYDMSLIGAAALEHEIIRETVKKPKARDLLLSGDDVTWTNSNKLVKQGSGYYYSHAIGLKTGTSGKAGRCLISAATKDGATYVSVVMDSSIEGRWQDSVDLLRYAIE